MYFYSGESDQAEAKEAPQEPEKNIGPEELMKIMQNPEMAELLKTLVKAMDK